jgi:hypothetical protein
MTSDYLGGQWRPRGSKYGQGWHISHMFHNMTALICVHEVHTSSSMPIHPTLNLSIGLRPTSYILTNIRAVKTRILFHLPSGQMKPSLLFVTHSLHFILFMNRRWVWHTSILGLNFQFDPFLYWTVIDYHDLQLIKYTRRGKYNQCEKYHRWSFCRQF